MRCLRYFAGIQFFSFTKNTAKCKMPDWGYLCEPKCGSELHSKPLADHLKRKLIDEYKKAVEEAEEQRTLKRKHELISNYFYSVAESSPKRPKREVIEIEVSKEMVQEFAVEAVTVNGSPLAVFDKSGIAKLISPISCKLGI